MAKTNGHLARQPFERRSLGDDGAADNSSSSGVILAITILLLAIFAVAIFVAWKRRSSYLRNLLSKKEPPPSKASTVDGKTYDKNDIFVRGIAGPMLNIQLPSADSQVEELTTQGVQRTSMLTDLDTNTKVGCVAHRRVGHGRVDSATPALIHMIQTNNEADISLNIDTDVLEDQDFNQIDMSNDFNFTSRLQKEDSLDH